MARRHGGLKFDVPGTGSGRKTRYVSFKGTRQEAQRELTQLLGAADAGTLPDPSNAKVAENLRAWLGSAANVSPKTAERYGELIERQVIPHLGTTKLQRLAPEHMQQWHGKLLEQGLAPRTVGHAHRVLRLALQRAVKNATLARNVAAIHSPPRVEEGEIEILGADQIADVFAKLDGHTLFPIISLALATGMRRGELLGLQWGDIDLDAGKPPPWPRQREHHTEHLRPPYRGRRRGGGKGDRRGAEMT